MQGNRAKACSYFLVRYIPNLLRNEGLNIGILLHCPEERYLGCRFAEDFRWLRRLDPKADLELLSELQADFERQIDSFDHDQEGYLQSLRKSLSTLIQLEGPRACLLADPQTEIEELYQRSVGLQPSRKSPYDSRLQVKQRLTAALMRAGVWERLDKRVSAERWTQAGDPFRFDYGYEADVTIRLIHALCLKRDTQLAKTLVYTVDCIRRLEPAELTAVVDSVPEAGNADKIALATRNILEEGRIVLQPLAGVETFASSIRQELHRQ
jgi:hypothetical protein